VPHVTSWFSARADEALVPSVNRGSAHSIIMADLDDIKVDSSLFTARLQRLARE
jgi:hypothetical protein